MMFPWLIDSRTLPLLGAACAALLSTLAVVAWRRRAMALRRCELARDAAIAAVRDEVRSQSAMLVTLAAHVDRLREEQVANARFGSGHAAGAEAGYELAIRLATHGASAQELVAACGLKAEDARLLLRLHGGARPMRAA
jgi:hypothetical protein